MPKVCIDPGHGGSDPGAVGPSGLKEADVAFAVSEHLAEDLKRTGKFEVLLTRRKSESLGVRDRGRKAAAWGADLFISEHCNSASSSATGTEIYYSIDLPKNRGLAAELSKSIAETLSIVDRGAKIRESENYPGEDYYGVIDAAQDGGVPVVLLVENAFISNPQEEALLARADVQRRIARAQAQVICRYFGIDLVGEVAKAMFRDIMGHWAQGNIEHLAQLGIVRGREDGTFAPNDNITRAEVAVIVDRAISYVMAEVQKMIKGAA